MSCIAYAMKCDILNLECIQMKELTIFCGLKGVKGNPTGKPVNVLSVVKTIS